MEADTTKQEGFEESIEPIERKTTTYTLNGEEIERIPIGESDWWDIVLAPKWGRLMTYQRSILSKMSGADVSWMADAEEMLILDFSVGWSWSSELTVDSIKDRNAAEVVPVAVRLDEVINPLLEAMGARSLNRFTRRSKDMTKTPEQADPSTPTSPESGS